MEGTERDADGPTTAPPPPAGFNEVTPVAVGTAVWALLFVIGLFIHSDLEENGRAWWIWTAAAGAVLGLFGYWFMRRRQQRILARGTPDRS